MWLKNTENSMSKTPILRKNAKALIQKSLHRRHAAETRFKWYGLIAICLGLSFVSLLFIDIISKGYPAFTKTTVRLDITFDAETLDPTGERDPRALGRANYAALWRQQLRELFPDVERRREQRQLYSLISSEANLQLRDRVLENPDLIGTTQPVQLLADDLTDSFFKGNINRELPEAFRPLKDNQIAWLERLQEAGKIERQFNTWFFTQGDSRNPEVAGIRGALMGSLFTLIVTLTLSFPVGIAAAVYLEEFAPKNRWTDIIEVNINNLAAVPSIVFGLLGLAVFINFFGLPRSVPLVGGLVLTLMTLPTIIIASRAALKSVPPSIREAALGMGASRLQMVTHHVLPLAMPGMLTGTIIGMAQALGETAPLLMIGMVAFIVDVPNGPLEPATVLPVQIFLWADLPERAFVERTSAAIMVLLGFLITMNALAVILRRRFERRW
jgi:phosphate transport system permease protein